MKMLSELWSRFDTSASGRMPVGKVRELLLALGVSGSEVDGISREMDEGATGYVSVCVCVCVCVCVY